MSDGRRGTPRGDDDAHPDFDDVGHWLGFIVSGGCAFATDAGMLSAFIWLGAPPLLARLGAICLAMVVAWQAHRNFTFRMSQRSSGGEFLRYAGVAWVSAATNYAIFAMVLLFRPELHPLAALVVSSLGAMTISYLGMRFAAFRRHGHARDDGRY